MQTIATWTTRFKWILILGLIVLGAFHAVSAYTECRSVGTDNVTCGFSAILAAYITVALQVIVALFAFVGWMLP
jgi:hypothetical protein